MGGPIWFLLRLLPSFFVLFLCLSANSFSSPNLMLFPRPELTFWASYPTLSFNSSLFQKTRMYRVLSPMTTVVPVTSVVPVAGDVQAIVSLTSFSPCNWCCSCGECCHVRSVVTATNTFPVTGVVWLLTQMS